MKRLFPLAKKISPHQSQAFPDSRLVLAGKKITNSNDYCGRAEEQIGDGSVPTLLSNERSSNSDRRLSFAGPTATFSYGGIDKSNSDCRNRAAETEGIGTTVAAPRREGPKPIQATVVCNKKSLSDYPTFCFCREETCKRNEN